MYDNTRIPLYTPRVAFGQFNVSPIGLLMRFIPLPVLAACLLTLTASSPARAQPNDAPRFTLALSSELADKPLSGRVLLAFTRQSRDPLQQPPAFFGGEPLFAMDVDNWRPGQTREFKFSPQLSDPAPIAGLAAGTWRVRAVLDLTPWTHEVLRAPGNPVTDTLTIDHDPAAPAAYALTFNARIPQPKLEDTPTLKFVRQPSPLLSKFHNRPVTNDVVLSLPEEYSAQPDRRFPAVYVISGFGGTLANAPRYLSFMRNLMKLAEFPAVLVFMPGDCPTGHHVYADSANNGPVGTAFVKELIPHLEQQYRLVPHPHARLLTGVSSGGWSSLWLQITHPDTFGAVWAFSPDPVDFRAFQTANLYDNDTNLLRLPNGDPRIFMTPGFGRPPGEMTTYIPREVVLGRGGQFYSFDACFSPRGKDRHPSFAWDRATGKLNPAVVKHWRQYDIRLKLEKEWKTLGPKLAGKLNLYCGDADEFLLHHAFVKLRDSLQKLGSDAQIVYVPGGGHFLATQMSDAAEEMAEFFQRHHNAE